MNNSQKTKQSRITNDDDVIYLGDHILVCHHPRTVMLEAFLDRPIKLVLTDPPYEHEMPDPENGDGDGEYVRFTEAWLQWALQNLSADNSIYIFSSDKMIFALRDTFLNLKIKVLQLVVWGKERKLDGRSGDYHPQRRFVLNGLYDKPLDSQKKNTCGGGDKISLNKETKFSSLLYRIILNNTSAGDLVYDPFGFRGDILLACEHTGRKCLTIEDNPEFCDVIIRRWEKLTGKTHEKEESYRRRTANN